MKRHEMVLFFLFLRRRDYTLYSASVGKANWKKKKEEKRKKKEKRREAD